MRERDDEREIRLCELARQPKAEGEAGRVDHLDDDEASRRAAFPAFAQAIEEGPCDPLVRVALHGGLDRVEPREVCDHGARSGGELDLRLEHVHGDAGVVADARVAPGHPVVERRLARVRPTDERDRAALAVPALPRHRGTHAFAPRTTDDLEACRELPCDGELAAGRRSNVKRSAERCATKDGHLLAFVKTDRREPGGDARVENDSDDAHARADGRGREGAAAVGLVRVDRAIGSVDHAASLYRRLLAPRSSCRMRVRSPRRWLRLRRSCSRAHP